MVSRRSFLAYTGGTTLTLYAYGKPGGKRALARIPGGSMPAQSVPKFRTPMLIPPVMPKAGTVLGAGGKAADYYEISVKQFAQQILPAGLPATTVWGYGAVASESPGGLLLHHAPSLTLEAQAGTPVRVKWINDLKDASGHYLAHLLPVDPTLHWANVPQQPDANGLSGPDRRPSYAGKTFVPLADFTDPNTQYTRYTGPVPIVTHVHGAVGVGDESDGYAQAWYLPDANDIPATHAKKGSWYDFFAGKAAAKFGATWGPGYASFEYPNPGRASTQWYHDHTLGMTRLNVYAGPAGFYLIRGGPAGDAAVMDSRTRTSAVLPGPAPRAGDDFPPSKTYYEIPIAIQDRSFNRDGSLFYPDSRAFFDGVTGPYLPVSDLSPIWNPEFFGNMMMVNGSTWPYQTIEQRRYRFRILNGCQSRFLILDFSHVPGVEVWQIGNEGGLLAAPLNLTAGHRGRVLLSPAERADLIVDFTRVPFGHHVLRNIGPDEPFGGGEPRFDFPVADPHTTGLVMQFRVVPSFTADLSTPPQFLVHPAVAPLPAPALTRRVALLEQVSTSFADSPTEAQLGTIAGDPNTGTGVWTEREWSDPVTENPAVGSTEVWEIYNATEDAHPIHLHDLAFEVIDRQDIAIDEASRTVQVIPGTTQPRQPWETGVKDTVVAYPGQVTRIRGRFMTPGQYVWHCHIVEHEDNEMMRPYRIGPVQPGQPDR